MTSCSGEKHEEKKFSVSPAVENSGSRQAVKLERDSLKIGNEVWMTENLSVAKFRNDDPITQAKTKEEWKKAGDEGTPAWCYNDNDPANGRKYGKLYNWYAVNDPRGLAPEGWHVPTDEEWKQLIGHLGGIDSAGTRIKSTGDWIADGSGTNESGFTGLPGGVRDDQGTFGGYIGYYGFWWSSTEFNSSNAWAIGLNFANGRVDMDGGSKGKGFSVRCTRDLRMANKKVGFGYINKNKPPIKARLRMR